MALPQMKDLVSIAPGVFLMGNETTKIPNRSALRAKITNSFQIMKLPVTQKSWTDVMGTKPWKKLDIDDGFRAGPDFPAVGVTWYEACEFAKALSAKTKYQFRLPTECEWEYALRAGTKTQYFWGDDEKLYSKYAWCGTGQICKVGTLQPNPWGLFDMAGNVSEWVLDLCSIGRDGRFMESGHYPKRATNFVSLKGLVGIARGGAYNDDPDSMHSTYKQLTPLDRRSDGLGFRLVVEESPSIQLKDIEVLTPDDDSIFMPIEYYWEKIQGCPKEQRVRLMKSYTSQLKMMEEKVLSEFNAALLKEMLSKKSLKKLLEYVDLWEEKDLLKKKHGFPVPEFGKEDLEAFNSAVAEIKRRLN